MTKIKNLEPITGKGFKTRAKLLEAAGAVIGTKGYYEASIVEITECAGVALGTFYTYFESKYEIYEELLRSIQREIRKNIKERTEGIEDRLGIEKEGYKAFFHYLKKNPNFYRLFSQAEFVNEELSKEFTREIVKVYKKRLAVSMEKGEIRKLNPELLAYNLVGIVNQIGMKWLIWEEKEITDDLIDDLVDELMDFLSYGIASK